MNWGYMIYQLAIAKGKRRNGRKIYHKNKEFILNVRLFFIQRLRDEAQICTSTHRAKRKKSL